MKSLPTNKRIEASLSYSEKLCAGYGAYALWLLIAPSRFGYRHISEGEMLMRHEEVQKELRMMFHSKGFNSPRPAQSQTYMKAYDLLRSVRNLRPEVG